VRLALVDSVMVSSQPIATEDEIWRITRRTINILVNHVQVKNVCLIGSAASALWANINRVPKVRALTSSRPTTNLLLTRQI